MAKKINKITILGNSYEIENHTSNVIVHRAIPMHPHVGNIYYCKDVLKYKNGESTLGHSGVINSKISNTYGNLLVITKDILEDGVLNIDKADAAIVGVKSDFCSDTTSDNFKVYNCNVVCVTDVRKNILDDYEPIEIVNSSGETKTFKSYKPNILKKTVARRLKRAYGKMPNELYKTTRFMKPRKFREVTNNTNIDCGMLYYGSVFRKHRMFYNTLSTVVKRKNKLFVFRKDTLK